MLTLMQTGLVEAYGTQAMLSAIILHYAGKSCVAWIGRRRANGKTAPVQAKCWLDDTAHEEMLRGTIGRVGQACDVILEKGSDKRPLVWREPEVAEAVASVDKSIRKLDVTMLRICDALDLRKIGQERDGN